MKTRAAFFEERQGSRLAHLGQNVDRCGADIRLGLVLQHGTQQIRSIRRGKLTSCIVNKGYQGAGERLESGTLSPQVERERKVPPP